MEQETLVKQRLAAARKQFSQWQVEALYVSSPANRRWLSGFQGSAGWLLISTDRAWLATDFRYWQQAQAQAPAYTLYRLTKDRTTSDMIREAGVTRVAVEGEELTLSAFNKLERLEGVEWKVLGKSVEAMRAIKVDAELAQIRAAARITDHVMAKVPRLAAIGQSERELAWQLEKEMRELGADGMAFPVHVASGPNAALPHHLPGSRRLQEGDTLMVDMGARTGGYCSDLTRTFYLGNQPSEQFQNVYTVVLEAQTAALDAIRPGIAGEDVDAVARGFITDAGHGDHFGHGLGHGLGLQAHEAPRLSRSSSQTLAPGMVTTVEPGIYLPDWGGVRIEDLVLVTENGVELLSYCPKEPIITGLS